MKFSLSDTYNESSAPVAAFITGRPRTPESLINVLDLSEAISENSTFYNQPRTEYLMGNNGTFQPSGIYVGNVPSGQILVTDQWISGVPGIEYTPLFFQYQLKFDAWSDPRESLVLLNERAEVIDDRKYKIDIADQPLYPSGVEGRYSNALLWGFPPSGEYHRTRLLLPLEVIDEPYKVQYQRFAFGIASLQEEYVNPKPIYLEGPDWIQDGRSEVRVQGRLASRDELSMVRDPRRKVKLLPPVGDTEQAWCPRITVGHFAVTDIGDFRNATLYATPVPVNAYEENFTQNDILLAPAVPAMKIRQEIPDILDHHTIKIKRPPLVIHSSGVVNDKDSSGESLLNNGYPWYEPYTLNDLGSGKRTIVGTPSGITVYEGDEAIAPEDITDWNEEHGIIKFRRTVHPPLYVTYLRERRDIEAGMDLNPRLQEDPWASGAIRVVVSPDNTGWHYVTDNPSGVYPEGYLGENVNAPVLKTVTVNTNAATDMTAMISEFPDTVYTNYPTVPLGASGIATEHALLRFPTLFEDAALIPSGSLIKSAWLSLTTHSTAQADATFPVGLYRSKRKWNEWLTTWNNAAAGGGGAWTMGGAMGKDTDVEGEPDAVFSGPGTVDTAIYINVASGVQAWSDGSANDGWALIPSGAYETATSDIELVSDDNTGPSGVPSLTVTYLTKKTVVLASGISIGEYTLDAYRPSELTIIDARRPGGGVKEDILPTLAESDMYVE